MKGVKRKYLSVHYSVKPNRAEDDCEMVQQYFNQVLKICPQFLVLTFHLFEVDALF